MGIRDLSVHRLSVSMCRVLRLVGEKPTLNTNGRASDAQPVRASFWRPRFLGVWARSWVMAWIQITPSIPLAMTWMRSMLWHVVCAEPSSTVGRAKNCYNADIVNIWILDCWQDIIIGVIWFKRNHYSNWNWNKYKTDLI